MGFRFWRRIKIAPGLTLNFSKSGVSVSFGPRGARFTIGPRGRRATVGIPGTGLFYTVSSSSSERRRHRGRKSSSAAGTASAGPADRLSLGFFERLITPAEEKALVDGCRELLRTREAEAFEHLRRAGHLADGAFLAGFLALKLGRLDDAAGFLERAVEKHRRLGRLFARYGVSAEMSLPVTEEVTARVGPSLRGALLILVEVHQRRGDAERAIACLERLRRLEPADVVVKLSLAELLWQVGSDDRQTCRRIVRLAEGVENDSAVHAALMLYAARALRRLGLAEAAREVLTRALRRRRDRPAELLRALRYERGLAYSELGERTRARRDFERLYAQDPDYEDVAARLGLGGAGSGNELC